MIFEIDMLQSDKIRRPLPEDARPIHEAHMRSIMEVCSKDHAPEEINAWGKRSFNETQRLSSIALHPIWVVEIKNCVEGFAEIHFEETNGERKSQIQALYLTKNATGRGHGKSLLNIMLKAARDFGAKEVTLSSSITAHDFYLKHGFQDTGPLANVTINNQAIRCYPMKFEFQT